MRNFDGRSCNDCTVIEEEDVKLNSGSVLLPSVVLGNGESNLAEGMNPKEVRHFFLYVSWHNYEMSLKCTGACRDV